jgi:hypothetical protein
MASATGSKPTSTNLVSGKVLHKESGNGIANLLIELFDVDAWADPEGAATGTVATADGGVTSVTTTLPFNGDLSALYKLGDRIGSVITDAAGTFSFDVSAKDFNSARTSEQKPDLVLLVLAPDEPGLSPSDRLLHLAKDIYFNAGSSEAYIIRLPTALLEKKEIPIGAPKVETPTTIEQRVGAYINDKEREREFNAGAAEYHGAQAALETQARTAFRQQFLRKIGTDFSAVPLNGVLVADGDDLRIKNAETIGNGIVKANAVLGDASQSGVPVNLFLEPADIARLQPFFANPTGDFVDIPDADMGDILFRTNSTENPGTLLIHNNPIANFCAAETADDKCAKTHTDPSHDPEVSPPDVPMPDSADAITDNLILTYIDRVVQDMQAPDRVLRPELTKRPDKATIEKMVNEFSLQKGPAEVPAFYDFNSLQIAFDHVWKQLFDETIPNLAFTANTLGKANFGIDGVVGNAFKNGLLVADVFWAITPVEVPTVVARFFDITKAEFNELTFANRQQLVSIANLIDESTVSTVIHVGALTLSHSGSKVADLRIIQSLTEQGERLIDAVRHDDYYTLHRTLRDLNDRLSGKYEFTVFAADKDFHSVNFGLMNTYRQQWTPLMYQAGKLVKTIPLAPKEERKYSVKVRRQEKRSSKEAKKNNSAITNEQSSTSRVEADIMAKAQNKSNFGLNAEGDFDIGLYQGKATTTFGVEAASESSQNRKDFREAVLKAVQDYKDETSTEVTTDSDFETESNDSGTIVNPNDELAVTYLFYELQKRYRLSEQLYRVMPVVCVAQEMPSPDQITPAWVISNDWILNRHLLDDSFRPTLRYLANNSVGDDYSLRELRKNLRQQRNLVETLRIEFSAASMQADNRYRALEAAITNRIAQEHAEANDGLLNDVADFIGRGPGITALFGGAGALLGGGGGGPDPEAAKARELAAKDAHQYALEKAEKAAAALKQEISTLHTLTEQYNKAVQARLDNETRVRRLLVHIRNNIFYYMQAIWSMEPPDQRYLRLYKVQVPVLELENRSYRVKVQKESDVDDIFARFRKPDTEKHRAFLHGTLKHNADGAFDTKPLVEVADLDNLLGFKGNYMIFAMREHNALTEFMAAPYVDSAFGAMDPDELSNVTLDEYSKYVCCLHDSLSTEDFDALKPQLLAWLRKLLATPLRNGDEIVVPTGSLFIESLVDPNPILEDFKLKHRELDVCKVQEEVRRAQLESLRLAARLLHDEREDPDVEKKIVVTGSGVAPGVDVDNP